MTNEGNYWDRFWQRRLSRRRLLKGAGVAGAGLAAVAVVGCGEEEKPLAAPPTAPGATPAVAQPKRGGKLVTYNSSDPVAWNINTRGTIGVSPISSLAYAQLTRLKTGPGRGLTDYEWAPHLARSVEQPDHTTYTFKLQPNAAYAPRPPTNGRKLTAQDVKASWDYAADKNPNLKSQARYLQSVETPDAETLVFKLRQPLAPFLIYMNSHYGFFPIPRELTESGDADKTSRGGENGPFMLKEYKVGSSILWEKNPNYFDSEHVYVDELEMLIVPDASTQTAGFRAKQLHVNNYQSIPIADVPSLKKDVRDATFADHPQLSRTGYTMDLTLDIFKDVRVRRAISMATNRNDLKQFDKAGTDLRSGWFTALGPVGRWWLDPEERNADYGPDGKWWVYNLAEARQLLQAAGWDFDRNVTYRVAAASGGNPKDELVQRHWRDVGLKTELTPLDPATYNREVFLGNYRNGLAHTRFIWAGADAEEYLLPIYTVPSRALPGGNDLLAQDTRLKELLQKQESELNTEARVRIFHDLQKHLASVMYDIPSTTAPHVVGIQSFVKNAYPLQSGSLSWFYNAWLDL